MYNIFFAISIISVFIVQIHCQYDLRNLPFVQRSQICSNNVAFCLNACQHKITSNTCDANTMIWVCQCDGMAVPVSKHYFPLQATQCIGENQDCRDNCFTSGNTGQALDSCGNICDQQFVCGTPNATEKIDFSAESAPASSSSASSSSASSTSASSSSASSTRTASGSSTRTASGTAATTMRTTTDIVSTTTNTPSTNGAGEKFKTDLIQGLLLFGVLFQIGFGF